VSTFLRPAHLLSLAEALAHHRVDRRFDETGRNPLAVAVSLGIVRDRAGIVGDVDLELARRFAKGLQARVIGFEEVEVVGGCPARC